MENEFLLLIVVGIVSGVIIEILKKTMPWVFEKIIKTLISFKIFLRARIFRAWIKVNQKAIILSVDEFFDIARGSFDLRR